MSDITANIVVSMPSQLFTMARSFKAVAKGKIYIGLIDTDPVNPANQIQVYLENEDGSHVPVPQPIIINDGGYPVYNGQIAKFVTVQGHSMAVHDAYGAQQFYYQNVLKYDPDQLRQELASLGGAALVGPGVMSRGNDKFSILQGRSGEQFGSDATRGIGVRLAEPITGSDFNASTAKFNYIRIDDDRLNAVDDVTPGQKVDGLMIVHQFGGTGTKGGRHAAEFLLSQNAPTENSNTDRNYVGCVGMSYSATADGGSSGAPRGGYFGGNFVGSLGAGALNSYNVSGAEFNVKIATGASAAIRTGLQVAGQGDLNATNLDAGISIGCAAGSPPWNIGLYIGDANGGESLGSTSRAIAVKCVNVDRVISLQSVENCNHILYHNTVKLTPKGLRMEDTAGYVTVGSPTVSSVPYIEGRSSGSGSSYDSRITFSGGSSTVGSGVIGFVANLVTYSCTQRPSTDNIYDYGSASFRGRTAYFGTGAINTSDSRHKPVQEKIPDAVLDAWSVVDWRTWFKFDDAVAIKGEDGARWHFGLIAQRVEEVFAAYGIDGFSMGLLCYDEWGEEKEVLNDDGDVVSPGCAAGNRYGIRYEEALSLEAALQRRNYSLLLSKYEDLAARIEAMEGENND